MASTLNTPTTDSGVDIPLLVDRPLPALLPILRLLPGWETVQEGCVTVEQLSGAMTNMVYRCGRQEGQGEAQAVLMRVHASSTDLFDRAAELESAQAVASAGLGPRLLLLFSNGRVEEFLLHHVTLAAADIHEPVVSRAIAATIARFHCHLSAVMAESKHPQHRSGAQLWRQMRAWLAMVQQLTPAAELQLLGMSNLQQEIQQLQVVLSSTHPCWTAMCHNDAQYGNIMAAAPTGLAADDDEAAAAPADAAAGQLQQLSLSHVPGLCQGGAASMGSASDVDEISCISVAGSSPSFSGLSGIMPASTAAGADTAGGSSGDGSARQQQQQQQARQGGGKAVQLRDGRLMLPGMKSRLRGQSPERAKRPAAAAAAASAGGTNTPPATPAAGAGAGTSSLGPGGGSSGGIAGASAAAAGSSVSLASLSAAEQQVGSPEVALRPPSAAAVMRHSSSQGELLLPALLGDASGAAAAGPAGRKKKAARISFPGSDVPGDDESVEDSEDADDLLLPVLMEGEKRATGGGAADGAAASSSSARAASGAAAGRSSSTGGGSRGPRSAAARASVGGASELAADAAAAASRSARLFRQLRKKRQTPAAGLEFPTFQGSDQDSDGDSRDEFGLPYDDDDGDHGDSSSSSLSDGDAAAARQQRLRAGATSRKQHPGSRPGGLSAAARAAAGASGPAAAAAGVAGLTLIDYEYSGFNPVAYDIANHWCEWAADYHSASPSLLDFSRLPTEQQQWEFAQAYLASLLASLGVSVTPAAATAGAGAAAAAGGAAAAGAAGGGGGSKSEIWSTLSSRGASVVSLPDTDVPFDAHSLCSVGLSAHSRHGSSEEEEECGGAAAARAAAGEAEARNVWAWLSRYQQQQQQQPSCGAAAASSGGGAGGAAAGPFASLDEAAFNRLCGSLVEAARAYMAASHLFWCLWGLIQARVSEVDWDFAAYAEQRWRQYQASRPAGLRPPEGQEQYNE